VVNLAAIGWEEFEHLIRELFEKEFSAGGGEVKVTQASRDGGVDAIAFDPDPIRGGKIVIQAKRYTNTVDVSAVRDLYGTVMAEGATKGILVTTSGFGPDAHRFAKGKPLTYSMETICFICLPSTEPSPESIWLKPKSSAIR
jgi:restriction system protein